LVHACDGDFTARFTTWAREHPKTTTSADAAAFAAAEDIDWNATPRRWAVSRLFRRHRAAGRGAR
ncbi:hypothetical protein, partial [Nocardia nova]|uniref:hypothetical protein n=1 Tax=Nocardia nova TaxID=37330 RepID=UPI001E5F019B